MKKLSVLIALALLVVAGTGYAVTCAQDNVPGATLLVPYFKVSGNGTTGGDIPFQGTDTLCAITNVSSANIFVHITVWNKYSVPVLDFNVPVTGYDVVTWSMRDVLNGKLNINPAQQNWAKWTSSSRGAKYDPCGQVYTTAGTYLGYFKNGGAFGTASPFLRFSAISTLDQGAAISIYTVPAFSGSFRNKVWTSLDESGDISDWWTGSQYVIDADNLACLDTGAQPSIKGDFTGYVTIDVANFCTLKFPDQAEYYTWDAIATNGWGASPGPNVLIGDIFFVDQTLNAGNISGDPMVSLEFDNRIDWGRANTFYGRYYDSTDNAGTNSNVGAATYAFKGDGREPIGGYHYAFRYVQDNLGAGGATSLRTWAIVWRGDLYYNGLTAVSVNLCGWWSYNNYGKVYIPYHDGFMDDLHKVSVTVYDNDETPITSGGGPSGGSQAVPYIFLETQRLIVTPNTQLVPANFYGGWVDVSFNGDPFYRQAWVGVQHTGYGLAMSVGHAASLISNQFVCFPNPTATYVSLPPFSVNGGAGNQTN